MRTDRGDIRELRPQVLLRRALDVFGADAVDDVADLLDGANAIEEELLAREPVRDAARVLEPELETSFVEVAHTLELVRGHDLIAEAGDLRERGFDDFADAVGRDARVDDLVARVDVVRRERVHVVRERALLAELEEEPARHPLAEDRVQHVERVFVWMDLRHAAPADANVCLLGAFAEKLDACLRRLRRRFETRRLPLGDRGEQLGNCIRHLVRVHLASDSDDDLPRRVPAVHEVAQLARRHSEHDLLAAGDLPAQRVVRIQQLVDERMYAVLRLIPVHPQLFDDHLLFGLDVGVAEHRREDHVRDDVKRHTPVARRHA